MSFISDSHDSSPLHLSMLLTKSVFKSKGCVKFSLAVTQSTNFSIFHKITKINDSLLLNTEKILLMKSNYCYVHVPSQTHAEPYIIMCNIIKRWILYGIRSDLMDKISAFYKEGGGATPISLSTLLPCEDPALGTILEAERTTLARN